VLLLWCKDSDEYRGVEIDADLEKWWSSNRQYKVGCEAWMAQTDPDPCDVGV
jgi:hypothetical protein